MQALHSKVYEYESLLYEAGEAAGDRILVTVRERE